MTEAHYVPTTGHAYGNRNTEENKRRPCTQSLPHCQGGTNMRAEAPTEDPTRVKNEMTTSEETSHKKCDYI